MCAACKVSYGRVICAEARLPGGHVLRHAGVAMLRAIVMTLHCKTNRQWLASIQCRAKWRPACVPCMQGICICVRGSFMSSSESECCDAPTGPACLLSVGAPAAAGDEPVFVLPSACPKMTTLASPTAPPLIRYEGHHVGALASCTPRCTAAVSHLLRHRPRAQHPSPPTNGRKRCGQQQRCATVCAALPLSLELPTLIPVQGSWGVWSALIFAGAFGLWSERTRLGKELSG